MVKKSQLLEEIRAIRKRKKAFQFTFDGTKSAEKKIVDKYYKFQDEYDEYIKPVSTTKSDSDFESNLARQSIRNESEYSDDSRESSLAQSTLGKRKRYADNGNRDKQDGYKTASDIVNFDDESQNYGESSSRKESTPSTEEAT